MSNLHDYLDEQEGVEDESFKVTDEATANWALRKIGQMEDQINNNNDIAQKEIDKIERWFAKEKEQAQNSIDSFQSLLAEYATRKREEDPKFKSLKLPNGHIGFRKRQPKWNYDNDKVIKSLESAGLKDLIRVKKEPSKADIKKALKVRNGKVSDPETGEVIEGITVEEQPDNFNVRVD